MACRKIKGGWRIRLESGRILPKIYKTLKACKIRVEQLDRHAKK